ncbi:MAG: hydrophobe/amphiphile efflux-3 (HAE3) family transporter [Dehalococcoidia bacterium]|nr:hydrophobe/amphiphile efflux-3 (HAE3) family transporter [Dehalococcoidia bacterium]
MLAKISGAWFGLIKSKPIIWILVALLLLIPAGILATNVSFGSDYTTMMRKDSQGYKEMVEFDKYFASENMMVIMEADHDILVNEQNYAALKKLEDGVRQLPNVFNVQSPAFMVEFMKGMLGQPNASPDDMIMDPANPGQMRGTFKSFFFNPDAMRLIINLKGDLTLDDKGELDKSVKKLTAEAGFSPDVKTTCTGVSYVIDYANNNIADALTVIMIIAFILMFLVLLFFFKMRGFFAWRFLALGVVVLGLVYTFGIMGIVDLNVALASVGAFPILLGLGVDYVVQFHNRYDEEQGNGKTADEGGLITFTHIGPPIIIAVVVGCVGFATALLSKTPMVQDFGWMLIIGALVLLVAAPTILMASLYRRDQNKPAQAEKNITPPVLERWLGHLSPKVVKYGIPIIIIGVILTGLGWAVEGKIKTTATATDFVGSDVQVTKDFKHMVDLAGGASASMSLIEVPDATDPQVLQWMVDRKKYAMDTYSRADGKGTVNSQTSIADLIMNFSGGKLPATAEQAKAIVNMIPEPLKKNFITPDFTKANIATGLQTYDQESYYIARDEVTDIFSPSTPPPGATQYIAWTGTISMSTTVADDLADSRDKMTFWGIGLCLIALLVMFKLNWKRVITAALPIGLILGWSNGLTWLMDIKVNPVMATMTALILGIGTEFTILLLMRYYEERDKGANPVKSMSIAMTKIGRAIIISGLMVVIGFGSMIFAFDFPIIADFGKVTLIDMVLCIISTLVVLPAIVVTFDMWREGKQGVKETVKQTA